MYVILDADFIYFSFKLLVCGVLTKTFGRLWEMLFGEDNLKQSTSLT